MRGQADFRCAATGRPSAPQGADMITLVAFGHVSAQPITDEDFLPASAAGVFASNVGDEGQRNHAVRAAGAAFERDLEALGLDADALYAAAERASIEGARAALAARRGAGRRRTGSHTNRGGYDLRQDP